MNGLPSGTVTFLFTDIEGSTRRWEAQADAMSAALVRHDAISQENIATHGGHVFKKVGDAFCAVFDRASDAVSAAVDLQKRFASEHFPLAGGFRVRMALHTGEAEERDGDYFGPAVNRVARLLHVAYGGQILLSAACAELVRPQSPVSLRDLGEHRLKDIREPEHIFQICATGLTSDFPALQTLDASRNNLPLQLTSFVGRRAEIDELAQSLQKERLITLVGPGGVGKTRLSLQLGAVLLESYPDGVWLIELAPIDDAEFIASTVISALDLRDAPDSSPTEAILRFLAERHAVLIFDNCEHLLDPVARLARAILTRCAGIRIIATSREALGIAGESIHRVAPLALPDPDQQLTPAAALACPAVALFVDRARGADDRFQLHASDVATVVRICRRLDGIALPIELAAARVKSMSLELIDEQLTRRFALLTSGDRAGAPRHKSLQATLDWSYELLDQREKMLFRRIGIFPGGFSLDAVTAICLQGTLQPDEILGLLVALVDKSLAAVEAGESGRYRLLESTREYAFEKLRDCGDCGLTMQKHAEFYCELAQRIEVDFYTQPMAEWFSRPRRELENFRSALSWALLEKGHEVKIGGTLAGALERFWYESGQIAEGQRWITRALEAGQPPPVAARLWLARATLAGGAKSSTRPNTRVNFTRTQGIAAVSPMRCSSPEPLRTSLATLTKPKNISNVPWISLRNRTIFPDCRERSRVWATFR